MRLGEKVPEDNLLHKSAVAMNVDRFWNVNNYFDIACDLGFSE
jgi:hypothetical protein